MTICYELRRWIRNPWDYPVRNWEGNIQYSQFIPVIFMHLVESVIVTEISIKLY